MLANISRNTLGASGCESCHDIVAQELRVFSVKTVAFKTWRITIREELYESKRQTDMDLKLDNKSQSFLKDLGTAERVVKSDWSTTFSVSQVTCGPDAAFSGDLCTATETSIGGSLGNGQTNRTESVTAGPLKYLA